MRKTVFCAALAAMAAAVHGAGVAETNPISDNVRGHEDIEWSTAYGYDMVRHGGRPRVLLIGDSIVCEYASGVRRHLSGKVNVSYWASSYCVTSPGYLKLLEHQLGEAEFAVIHFNNGLHSTGKNLPAYAEAMAAAVRLIHERQPKAKVVWASSTPLKDAEKNKTVIALNAAARPAVLAAGVTTVDDLYALADPLDRAEHWSDCYHHRPPLVEMLAECVAKTVLAQALDKDTFSAILENVISNRDLKELAKADMTLGQSLSSFAKITRSDPEGAHGLVGDAEKCVAQRVDIAPATVGGNAFDRVAR